MTRRKKTAKVQVPVRLVEALRAKLAKSAKTRDVSMNAEIVKRLERSFELEERFGGPNLENLIEAIASMMKGVGRHAGFAETAETQGDDWLLRPYPFDQAIKAAVSVMEHFRPDGEIVIPEPFMPAVVGVIGTRLDETARGEKLRQIYINLGERIADLTIREMEQDDE